MNSLAFSHIRSANCPVPYGFPEGDNAVGQDSETVFFLANEAWEAQRSLFRYINSPEHRFLSLKAEWERDTKFLSSVNRKCSHPAYQKIIKMGDTALPFIFQELRQKTGHWFWALKCITGEDPVPADKRGDMKEMARLWRRWWVKNRIRYTGLCATI